MADLIAYWRYDNYKRDLEEGAGFHFNSNQERLHSVLDIGDSLWLVTGRRESDQVGMAYYVVARLVVRAKTYNEPGYQYGRYRIWGDLNRSSYYKVGNHDTSDLLRRLCFSTNKPIGESGKELAFYLQTMRGLSKTDSELLDLWCKALPIEEIAYKIVPEYQLEDAIQQDSDAVRKLLREHQLGIAEYRVNHLIAQPSRSRTLSRQLHQMYSGRCQICGFDPVLVYGVEACHAHHLIYLSRGGRDSLHNMTLLCPNHHSVIHATDAVFDFRDLSFVFAHNHRERLALNSHLSGI
jgi:5-methylcytosine-specific restriction enzyme A